MGFLGHLQRCLNEKGSRTQKLWEETPELPLWGASPHSRQGRGQPQATNLSLRGLNCLLLLGQKEARLSAGEKISPIKCLYA